MSSAFRPQGVSAGRGVRTNQNRSDYPRDRLAIVDGYDLGRGVMLATEQDTERKLEVSIQQRNQKPGVTTTAPRNNEERKWRGNKIDALMAESLIPGSWVILESTRGNETQMRGKESVLPVAARWIVNVSEPRPDKCFTGIFTLTAYRGNVENIQAWEEKAIDAQDSDALTAFGEELDAINAAFKNRERPIRKGFQFRIVKQTSAATEGQNGRPGRPASYEVVDMSYPIDWINVESDDPDAIGEPPTNELFQSYVNGYIDHIWGAEDGSTPAKFSEDELQNMRFEIATYRIFKAGDVQYNERMRIPEPTPGMFPSALHQLANTATRFSEGEDYVVGKNWAVRGILQLINDSFDKKSNPPQIVPNFMARQLFANGPRVNVHNMVATSDAGRAKVIESLDRVLEKRDAPNAQAASGAGGSELSAPAGDQLVAPAEDPFGGAGDFLGEAADPFLDAAAAPAETSAPAAAPTEEAAPEASEASAEEAAPESTGTPAKSGRPGRFARGV